jgi:hypothetical protein
VVAGAGRLPVEAAARIGQQVDLDLVQRAGGLWIYRNARALPSASLIPGDAAVAAARSSAPLASVKLVTGSAVALAGRQDELRGAAPEGGTSLALVADRFDPRWRANSGAAPFPAFGWALGFEAPPGPVAIRFEGGPRRGLELAGLGLVWAAGLWMVRRRGREERRGRSPETAAVSRPEAEAEPAGRLSRA